MSLVSTLVPMYVRVDFSVVIPLGEPAYLLKEAVFRSSTIAELVNSGRKEKRRRMKEIIEE